MKVCAAEVSTWPPSVTCDTPSGEVKPMVPEVVSEVLELLPESPSAISPEPAGNPPCGGRPASLTLASPMVPIDGVESGFSRDGNSSRFSGCPNANAVGGKSADRLKPSPIPPGGTEKSPPALLGEPFPPAEIEPSAPKATSTWLASSAAIRAMRGTSTSPMMKVGTLSAPSLMTISAPSGCTSTRLCPSTLMSSIETLAGSFTTLPASA
ncbi:MAG: hypothetical protein E5Y26_27950 [Mesorhizobium sp.]|nr:MAG: hypothetical protein E5Y26_27950 [Mesorhizobium sp.]